MTGITGGIGSGKSTIARALAEIGYTVYDCDHEAKRIIEENEEVRKAIIGLLGSESFVHCKSSHCTTYNTTYVAKRVFGEPELLEKLNAIVHPEVKKDILAKRPDFVESAILYESGMDALCDKVIVVEAPEEVRIARTIARDFQGINSEENINKVRARIHAQQLHSGDLVLTNDGNTPISELVEKITHWM